MSSAIWTVPGSAVCSIRAARFTASPIAVYSSRRSEPTSPTTTGPVLIPTRTSRSRPQRRARARRGSGRDRRDDLEPGQDRALRVVLVRDRRAEEREDRVAHQPGDGPLVAEDRLDQMPERAVDDSVQSSGSSVSASGRRAPDVAEQHRHDAALAGALGRLGRRSVEARAARVAEPRALGVRRAAGRAGRHGRTLAGPAPGRGGRT